MLKTILILPDGTELSSGKSGENAIKSFSLIQCVNEAEELTLGSVCAAMAEITVLTDSGSFSVGAGDEVTVYREDETGIRHKIGIFIAEKPTKASANTVKLTAYDRVSRSDRDLTSWLESLTQWPYSLQAFSQMVCSACDLSLKSTQLPNGEYAVEKFSAEGITGRQLLRWIGELSGRFCRATADGELEFAWYSPVETVLAPTGDSFYFQKSLSYEDYSVAPIQKVQLRQNDEDVGTVYPDVAGSVNTYIVTGNPLMAAGSAGSLIGIAQTLYEQLQTVTYTPCKISIPAGFAVGAGDILTVTDRNGATFSAYVMTRKQSGGKDTLQCTGSSRRGSTSAVNNQSYKALSGKVLNLSTTVDGLKAENRDTAGRLASLTLDVEGISSEVSRQQTDLGGVKTQLTAMEQTAEAIDIRVRTLTEEGTKKVKTETGFTFDEQGLTISKEGTRMENLLNEEGMYVKRSGEVILQADKEGVMAADVSVRNYLIVGDHARFENYSSGTDQSRTACFWI